MEEKKKEKEVNLSDFDANFVISSFKNKERRNNPSSIPRALVPNYEKAESEQKAKEAEAATTTNNADISAESNKPNTTDESTASDVIDDAGGTTSGTETTKRTTPKERKAAFEEYRKLFLTTPKITHRKPVFISEDLRERLDEIARKLGYKGMSASGFMENMAIHHLKMYDEDIEYWRKL